METRKLKFSEKLAYGLADFPEAVNSILAAFLTMFYTDNIGLAAAAVGTMFFISKLFDGITDILAGVMIDKTKTKWGKARASLPSRFVYEAIGLTDNPHYQEVIHKSAEGQ